MTAENTNREYQDYKTETAKSTEMRFSGLTGIGILLAWFNPSYHPSKQRNKPQAPRETCYDKVENWEKLI